MDKSNEEFLDRYEELLEEGLCKLCTGAGLMDGEILRCPDIDGQWDLYIKEYVADAVSNFNSYPDAAIAWAAFLGMGVAYNWDLNWRKYRSSPYNTYYGSRGWDDMDEHVLYDMIGLNKDSPEAARINDTLLSCAAAALGLLQHEGVQTETAQGFYALSRTYTSLFRIGASIELKRLKYKKVAL